MQQPFDERLGRDRGGGAGGRVLERHAGAERRLEARVVRQRAGEAHPGPRGVRAEELPAPLRDLREGARLMKDRAEAGEKGGSLVACGSLSLFQGLPGKMEYAASKSAVAATIRCLAIELAPLGIRANVVAPGLVMTPMMGEGARADAVAQHFAPMIPMRRTGYPSDFEGIGAYLCSDASSFMTGETITLDGGYMIRP